MSSDYCFEAYSFSINQPTYNRSKSTELKFKIESVGVHPEDDDDLDMCPARTRPCWPKQIVPWWIASEPNEKPPYSYATLIAHSILSSKDGRLTLNDIYNWIAKTYPAFSVGKGGWQNSIRHNLSLNKKWFCKMERRPTQANPGKGCYWALVSGTEHIFIENLTQEYGHSRKHHDIGLTADLSVNQRRGACYYRNNHAESSSKTLQPDTELLDTPSKANLSRRSSSSPLYTTFRMTPGKSSIADDSDNDSGVDVSHERIDRKQLRKRRRTRNNTEITVQDGKVLQHVETSMVQDTSFGLMPDSSMNFEINNWIENYQQPMPSWCDSTVDTKPKKSPITIHLDDVTQFLHFDQENPITFETNYSSLYPSYYHYDYSLDNSTTLSNPCHLQQFVSMRDILYS